MGRKKTNRKVYHVTLDPQSRQFIEYIAEVEGYTLSYSISMALLDYMKNNYPDQLASIRKSVSADQLQK